MPVRPINIQATPISPKFTPYSYASIFTRTHILWLLRTRTSYTINMKLLKLRLFMNVDFWGNMKIGKVSDLCTAIIH